MSDPMDNEESDQEMPEVSNDDVDEFLDDEETEDDEFPPPVITNPAGAEGSPHPHNEDNLVTVSMVTEALPVRDGASNVITGSEGVPPEMNAGAEVNGSADQVETGSGSGGENADGLDAGDGKDSKVENAELENGNGLALAVVKEEALLKQEEGPGISPAAVKEDTVLKQEEDTNQSRPTSPNFLEGDDSNSGTEDDQYAFMKELERFHRERCLDFKPPKFYGEGLNCLKLWRAVARLGGYERVTSCKLWRQVGESFRPPKTCTTVSWTFRIFYEKALLEYEKHKICTGELQVPISLCETLVVDKKMGGNHASGSGRARRDAAARAMQGWHSQRLLGNGEVGDPIIKDKNSASLFKRDKHLKSIGGFSKKKSSSLERAPKVPRTRLVKPQGDSMVVDIGEPADWVKVNVRRTKDCYEIYALVPGLLREEVHVQSDPCGRLIISGQPEQLDNPWGVTPFKKVITLPSRIDPHQTSAVVTLHGQLFVRVPFELSDL